MILNLGIIDVPYDLSSFGAATKKRRLGRAKRGKAMAPKTNSAPGTRSTGDVAEILEAKYHIMEVFFEDVGADVIAGALEHSVAGAIENIAAGASAARLQPTAEAMGEIETAFRLFLGQQEQIGRAHV